ncbi:Rho-type gtpase-activating protein [Coemansia biformis]|uniref:Rho-type gtpase-activating protein n=1 Tax=Coemansia biformis TaxID=1286918 RepID=A0A9W7YG76_9FUNG|nr:Rho-type gtpase-activating protein [Coemansia biformis]
MSDETDRTKPSLAEAAADGAGAHAADTNLLNAPPKCWGCQNPIDGGSAIQFADGVWHIECFQCTTCSKVIEFDSNLLFLADGKPICPECSYCCSLCKKPIFDEAIVTVEGTYHSECFRCTNCKKRIQGKSFAKTSQGVIYCVRCYAERRERKKAARRRREHQIVEEKVLPKLPSEAAAAAAQVPGESRRSLDESGRCDAQSPGSAANPLSAGSTVASPPTTISPTASTDVHAQQLQQDARARKRTAHLAGDFSFGDVVIRAASPEHQAGRDAGPLSAARPPRSAGVQPSDPAAAAPADTAHANSTAAAAVQTTLSAPTSPIAGASKARSGDAAALPLLPPPFPPPPLPPPPSPLRDTVVVDPEVDAGAGMEWTEDITALERNFVRLSMRAPTPHRRPAPGGGDGPGPSRQQAGDADAGGRAGAEQRYHRHQDSLARVPALKRAGSVGKSHRSRAASSASMIGSMVPPGLRSSRENRPAPLGAGTRAAADEDEAAWLNSATVEQLKEELLVNYGQLCRLEVSYQKLRDLYATVVNQMLESREALQQERAKRAECEHILRNYYGYVPPDAGISDSPAKHQHHKQRTPATQLGSASVGSSSTPGGLATVLQSTSSNPPGKAHPQPQSQQPARPRHSGAGAGSGSLPQLTRQPSHRRQRPSRRTDAPVVAADHNDSGSDAEDTIITAAPQKATKRFIWPFGGGGGGNTNAAPSKGGAEDRPQHSFHLTSTFRTGRCDHCQERLKTFTNSVVRCRHCGFVCHQRCTGDVTASCHSADVGNSNRGRAGAQPSAASMPGADGQPIDGMFGRDLGKQAEIESQNVPWIVRAAVAFIELEGMEMEGVYRRSGSTMDISTVQAEISRVGAATGGKFDDHSAAIASPDMDVTSVTSVLKQYFRSLPNPLMTESTYHLWIQAAHIGSAEERINVYRTISDSMPAPHGETLRFLMQHLRRIASNHQENKMTTNNLSVVFAPNILHMAKENMLQEMANMSEINKTVSFLIERADEIWSDLPNDTEPADSAEAGSASLGPVPAAPFQLPPMKRYTEMSPFDLGGLPGPSPMVLSSPNSPAPHRFRHEHAGNSGAPGAAAGGHDGTTESSSLSRSMPSPNHHPFETMPGFQPRPNGRDGEAPPRASVDIPRLTKS